MNFRDATETERRALRRFIRETLGCACPDAVLEDLKIDDGGPTVSVGGRLLVEFGANPGAAAAPDWPSLRARRTDSGHARLRHIVLDPASSTEEALNGTGAYEACHVHRLPLDALAELIPLFPALGTPRRPVA